MEYPFVNVAGLKITALTKNRIVEIIRRRLHEGKPTWLTTVYSEFLYRSLKDKKVRSLLNQADLQLPDGIAILWASWLLLHPPRVLQSRLYKIVAALYAQWLGFYYILFNQKPLTVRLPEKIVGADFFWDLVNVAAQEKQSVYFLGGFGDTPKLVADLASHKYPDLHIAGFNNKDAEDPSVIDDIRKANPDFLFVAYGPVRQEEWIARYRGKLGAKLYIGLGGTFDYAVGKKKSPPQFIRSFGLEWFYRFITQPHRFFRILEGTFGLMRLLLRYQVFMSYPYRQNVVAVVVNEKKEVFVGKRNTKPTSAFWAGQRAPAQLINYWQFPQGGIDKDESIEAAAVRELKEETSISQAQLLFTSSYQNGYTWEHPYRMVLFNPLPFKGQRQSVVYFYYQNNDQPLTIDQHEFIDYAWVPFNQLETVLHPERQNLLKIVELDLSELDKHLQTRLPK
jgi:N-acetylglucosaminyldiphosphoundecaprenol N-acetyl-beta-D-mannosaminyltransferase